jgi:hypothetical protein
VDNPQLKIMTAPVLATEPYNSFNGVKATVTGLMIGAVL